MAVISEDELERLLHEASMKLLVREWAKARFWQRRVAACADGPDLGTAQANLTAALDVLAKGIRKMAVHIPTVSYACDAPNCPKLHRLVAVAEA